MTSSKRNIIIVAALVLLLSISGLHMAIFKPSAQRYKAAVAQFNAEASQLQAMKNANPDELNAFMNETEEMINEISQGISQLDIEQPIEFLKIDGNQVTLENPPPNASQTEIDTLKANRAIEINAERREVQMELLLDEVEALRAKRNNRVPQNTFLTNRGWALSTDLPDYLKTGQLWDLIKDLAEQQTT